MDVSLSIDPISAGLFAIVFGWLWTMGQRYDAISERIDALYLHFTGHPYSPTKKKGVKQ